MIIAPTPFSRLSLSSLRLLFHCLQHRQVYIHLTTATDTSNIQMVFDACKDIWLSEALDTFNF